MVSKHGGAVALGGSHFYSELDGDWHEAANILRRLSKNTYCLQWLDLEGCAWIQALTWEPEDTSSSTTRRTTRARGLGHAALADSGNRRRADAAWEASAAHVGPDWNGAWRQVEYINMFQGWMPRDVQRVQSMPAGYVNVQLLSWLREHGDDEAYADKWGDGSVSDWVEREKGCRSTGVEILRRRRKWEGRWVCVDHGWEVGVRVRRGDGEGEDE
ncbi:hypothetical protein K491DRAFT_671419 [Lophiostoma macrostomum CBS 122681]|uniref:Uncharacterized protein n=1 Tax=Lophiostoma macrostomum CBS 122681 TaxID=1314788 RepID=A0A6A6SNL3_9PLEO|nr:hypothetical protein K491DRAFT_671419 [Lophiostoma macrostomum CBS 122681]